MIKKIAKLALKVLVLLVGVLILGYLYLSYSLDERMQKAYAIETRDIKFDTNAVLLAQGEHLYTIKGCAECHGPDLAGKIVLDDPAVGKIAGSNITYGTGGLPKNYTTKDWLRALRHGVNKDGKPLLIMPSHEIYRMSDKDISALIAYCLSQPPVNKKVPAVELRPLGTVLSALGQIPLLPAEQIDHSYRAPTEVEALPNAVYGEYLAVSCSGCHKQNFKGGEPEVPGMKPYPDITASGAVGRWTEQQFVTTLRTGKTPEGKVLNNEEMPWTMTRSYTDTELIALYAFLKEK